MSVANHTIVDGDPMVCGYLTAQMILTALCVIVLLKYHRSLTLQWNIAKTKDFLAGLTVEWHPLVLQSSSIKIGPDQWDIQKLAVSSIELGTWTGYFTGTNCSHRNYFFRYNQSYVIQACVPLPCILAIGSLQFSKTLHSVTCLNCRLYTCLNTSTSLRNESLLSLQSPRSLWLPINLQQPWEEGPMAGLASRILTKLLRRSKRFIGWLILGI